MRIKQLKISFKIYCLLDFVGYFFNFVENVGKAYQNPEDGRYEIEHPMSVPVFNSTTAFNSAYDLNIIYLTQRITVNKYRAYVTLTIDGIFHQVGYTTHF